MSRYFNKSKNIENIYEPFFTIIFIFFGTADILGKLSPQKGHIIVTELYTL